MPHSGLCISKWGSESCVSASPANQQKAVARRKNAVITEGLPACRADPRTGALHRGDPAPRKFTARWPPLSGTHAQITECELRVRSWGDPEVTANLLPTEGNKGLSGGWTSWEKFLSLQQNSRLGRKPEGSKSLGILLGTCVLSPLYHCIFSLQTPVLGNYLYTCSRHWRNKDRFLNHQFLKTQVCITD